MDNDTREKALKWAKEQAEKPSVVKPVTTIKYNSGTDNTQGVALRIAVKIIKAFEGCSLRSYPDPASPLSIELSKHNILKAFVAGTLELPPYLAKLSGEPYTAMYGETLGIKQGMVFTQEEADKQITARVREFMEGVLAASPLLAKQSPEKLAAVTSLSYNIGLTAYKNSTVARKIAAEDWLGAGEAFKMWDKAQGKVLQGLVNRREMEAKLFLSVKA